MSQLFLQLALGSALIAISVALQVLFIGLAMMMHPHLSRRMRAERIGMMMVLIAAGALWMLAGQSVGVWIWALALIWLDAFDALEPSLYFAIVSYTTLGFGDVLVGTEWRILGALIGANGMLSFGLGTAALVEFVTRIRRDARP